MAIQGLEESTLAEKIDDAAVVAEALAREFFGDAAYLRREIETDRETGKEDVRFEVHYCFDDPENGFDRLVELHQAFTRAFVRAVSSEVLSNVVLTAVPVDAD
jgi:hypothetical protein